MRNKIGMEPLPFSPAWLRQKFQETGKRPADLVEHLRARGIPMDATKLSKSMSDSRTRRIQPDERYPIWDFFGLDVDEFAPWNVGQSLTPAVLDAARVHANRDRPMPNAGLPERVRFDHSTLPILGKSLGSQANARVLFNGQPLGSVERPQRLANVPNAYATYVHGTSMEPRYEAGEIVLVNPEKPVRKDNYVVAQIYDNDGDPPYGYIKKFVSFSGKELVLLQLNPPEGEDEIMRFPKDRVLSVHRIVGTLDE